MQTVQDFSAPNVRVLLTDIDGTLTEKGKLRAPVYSALERLSEAGVAVVPVTGRPAGWCELIARQWPVHGVIGENGAFYFRNDGRMRRWFAMPLERRRANRARLADVRRRVLAEIPGCRVASDQFCRRFDLAIDFAEDVGPLGAEAVEKIRAIFAAAGAIAKVSDIHVNGWFGDYDKVSTGQVYLRRELGFAGPEEMKQACAFAGDSPNDEPMFAFFPYAFAVANIAKFWNQLKSKPAYVARAEEGEGFLEIAERLLTVFK